MRCAYINCKKATLNMKGNESHTVAQVEVDALCGFCVSDAAWCFIFVVVVEKKIGEKKLCWYLTPIRRANGSVT